MKRLLAIELQKILEEQSQPGFDFVLFYIAHFYCARGFNQV